MMQAPKTKPGFAGIAEHGSFSVFPAGSIPGDTRTRLEIYAELLLRWQTITNLVGSATLPAMWTRHFLDSMQVLDFVPHALTWIDIGSGAGFPGLVTAIQLAGKAQACVHLVESDQRKCAFLREVSRETGAPAIVHCGRTEAVLPDIATGVDAISARALAPLSDLIGTSARFLLTGSVGVFPKGKDVAAELTGLAMDSRFEIRLLPSKTNSEARVAIVSAALKLKASQD